MSSRRLNVAVLGTGSWTQNVHLPALQMCNKTRVLAVCGQDRKRTEEVAKRFRIPNITTNYRELLERPDIDVVDISTSSDRHFALAREAIKRRKAILCEKPLSTSFDEASFLSDLARSRGVKTKVVFGFRYSPAIGKMKELVDEGYLGRPYHFNTFIQNTRYMSSDAVLRSIHSNEAEPITPGSIQEYAPHVIDLALWFMGDLKKVVGRMGSFVPHTLTENTSKIVRTNIEDATVWIGEFSNRALATFQSSFVAIGPTPGLELRVYGSRGAMIARLPGEDGLTESLEGAQSPDNRFAPIAIPRQSVLKSLPVGQQKRLTPSITRFLLLLQDFCAEIANGREPKCSFQDGARAQEIVEAVVRSHLEAKWVSLPLASARRRFWDRRNSTPLAGSE